MFSCGPYPVEKELHPRIISEEDKRVVAMFKDKDITKEPMSTKL